MSFGAFPEALSAFAEQKTCTLSRNQEGEREEPEDQQRGVKGVLLKGGWSRRLGSSDCCNYAVWCITLPHSPSDGALKRSTLPGNTFLSPPCRGPELSNSSL